MFIIEIEPLENGGHRNQRGVFKSIPEGWAIIPEDMKTENFPFGEVTAEEVDGAMVVTGWIPGVIPEVEPIPEPGEKTTAEEILNTLLGVSE